MSATDMESVQLRSEFVEYMSSLPNFMRYKQFLDKYYNVTPSNRDLRQTNPNYPNKYYNVTPSNRDLRQTNANYPNIISTSSLSSDVYPSEYKKVLYNFSRKTIFLMEPLQYSGERAYIYIKNIELFEEITMLNRERFYYTCFNNDEYSMFITNEKDLEYIEKLLTKHNTPYTVKKTYHDSFFEIVNKLSNYLPTKVFLDKSISAAKSDNNKLTFEFTFAADSLESAQTIDVKDIETQWEYWYNIKSNQIRIPNTYQKQVM